MTTRVTAPCACLERIRQPRAQPRLAPARLARPEHILPPTKPLRNPPVLPATLASIRQWRDPTRKRRAPHALPERMLCPLETTSSQTASLAERATTRLLQDRTAKAIALHALQARGRMQSLPIHLIHAGPVHRARILHHTACTMLASARTAQRERGRTSCPQPPLTTAHSAQLAPTLVTRDRHPCPIALHVMLASTPSQWVQRMSPRAQSVAWEPTRCKKVQTVQTIAPSATLDLTRMWREPLRMARA